MYFFGPASHIYRKKRCPGFSLNKLFFLSAVHVPWFLCPGVTGFLPPLACSSVLFSNAPSECNSQVTLPLTQSKFPHFTFLNLYSCRLLIFIREPTHTPSMRSRLAELRWKTAGHLKSSGVVSHEMVLSSAQCSVTMAWLYSRALIWHQTGQSLLT